MRVLTPRWLHLPSLDLYYYSHFKDALKMLYPEEKWYICEEMWILSLLDAIIHLYFWAWPPRSCVTDAGWSHGRGPHGSCLWWNTGTLESVLMWLGFSDKLLFFFSYDIKPTTTGRVHVPAAARDALLTWVYFGFMPHFHIFIHRKLIISSL